VRHAAVATVVLGVLVLSHGIGTPSPDVSVIDLELNGPGENVDDPCFWVDPDDAARALVFVTTKDSGLVEVFDLVTGTLVTTIRGFRRPNNCAVAGDLLLTTDRGTPDVKVHQLPDFRLLGTFGQDLRNPHGIDVLHTPEGNTLVYVTDAGDASVHVYDLATGALVHAFPTGFGLMIEPLLVDDAHQRIFVAREEGGGHGIGLFTPDGTLVREFGAHVFSSDTEGMALYRCGERGYLVAADQGRSATQFEVFDRVTLDHLGTFRLRDATGEFTNATDGIDILQTPIPGFPYGLLAACDGCGDIPSEELDVVSWDRIAAVLGLNRCPGGLAPECRSTPCIERLLASADAYVTREVPTGTFGGAGTLEIESEQPTMALLRFEVPDLTGFDLEHASVHLTVDDDRRAASEDGGRLFRAAGSWHEHEVTYETRPAAVGEAVGSAGPVAESQIVVFDVTAAVRGPGTHDFALTSSSPNKAIYRSRDARESPPALLLSLHASEPPRVEITGPPDATAVLPGTPVTLTATAHDPEEGELSSLVTWASDRDGTLGVGATLTVSTLSPGTHSITAAVTDRAGLRAERTVLVRVNTPPTLVIVAPPADTVVSPDDEVTFRGQADDAEDGDLSGAITWHSDGSGFLGTGTLERRLPSGTHTITATVADSGGDSARARVTVVVNAAPSITISTPEDGAVLESGAPVTLVGVATDREDDALDAVITWTSDRNGLLGTGTPLVTGTLVPGPHAITASVSDGSGRSASATIRVVVNTAPALRIVSPADDSTVPGGTALTFTARAEDDVDGDLGSSVTWALDAGGTLGSGATVTAVLPEGTHQIVAAVTDSLGARATARLGVTVLPAPPTVIITSPAGMPVVTSGEPIALAATARDFADGDLGAAVTWHSSLQGHLGTGATLTVPSLTAGIHVIRAAATDSSGLVGAAEVIVQALATPRLLEATADGFVAVDLPGTSFGSESILFADGSPERQAFLRFVIAGVSGRRVERAMLRLTVSDARGASSVSGGVLHAVSDTAWEESTLTYLTRPPIDGPPLATLRSVERNALVEVDVTPAITGDGSVVFALLTSSDDGVKYQSREAASGRPTLVLHVGGAADTGPTVAIMSPPDGTRVAPGTPVTLAAEVLDGDPATLEWTSNLVGSLGTGSPLTLAALPPGSHSIRAEARDASGSVGTARIGLMVGTPPSLTLLSPADGTVISGPGPIHLRASALDPEDGDITGAITWTSSRDGALGTGADVVVGSLAAGAHVVTATVTDSTAITASTSARIVVRGGTLTFPPVADAWVSAAEPATRFGLGTLLKADARPERQAFLRFGLVDTGGLLPDRAVLRLTVAGDSSAGGDRGGTVHVIADTGWEETTLDYAHRPAVDGPALAVAGAVGPGDVLDFDVTPAIRGDGPVVLALVTDSSNGVAYQSREASSGRPQLILSFDLPAQPPEVTIIDPLDGATLPLGDPLRLVAVANDRDEGDLSSLTEWTSDVDGPLGRSATLVARALVLGPHVITASVTNARGRTATDTVSVRVTGGTLGVVPVADATVKAEEPDRNFGASATLHAEASPSRRSYLRFVVRGVGAGRVTQATLRLTVASDAKAASDFGGDIRRLVPTLWDERTITFVSSAPPDGPVVASVGPVASGQVVDFPLRDSVTGDGEYEFVLSSRSTDRVAYQSRESGTTGPRLILSIAE
jgi:myo-inositol-hexaphosphate 3-phosphohydrolase